MCLALAIADSAVAKIAVSGLCRGDPDLRCHGFFRRARGSNDRGCDPCRDDDLCHDRVPSCRCRGCNSDRCCIPNCRCPIAPFGDDPWSPNCRHFCSANHPSGALSPCFCCSCPYHGYGPCRCPFVPARGLEQVPPRTTLEIELPRFSLPSPRMRLRLVTRTHYLCGSICPMLPR